MASEWIECKLADACASIDYGLTASASDVAAGSKFLRITDIVSGHVDWNTVPFVDAGGANGKYKLSDGDVVLARTGASTGASAYIQNPPESVFASYLVRLKAKPEFSPRYLAYYMKSERFWSFIRGVLGDKSAQPNASASTMTQAPLIAPKDVREQQAIADVLGTLDDKIELNRKMNETLEAMARALFKSWFVDFDPVRAKAEGRGSGLPAHIAAIFPSTFVESPQGFVPQGWDLTTWGTVATLEYGKSLSGYDNDNGMYPVYGTNGRIGSCSKALCPYPGVIIGRKGAYRGVHYSVSPFFTIDTAFYVAPKIPIELRWAYYELLRLDINSMDSGSAIPSTSRDDFYSLPVVVPPHKVQRQYVSLMASVWQQQEQNEQISAILANLRDVLLPKLISGEIRAIPHDKVLI